MRERVKRTQITEQEFRACKDGEEMRALEVKRLMLNCFDSQKPINSSFDNLRQVWNYWQLRRW